jgi:hypothetical protein
MGRKTDAELVAEYLGTLGATEQSSGRMGGVVYRTFVAPESLNLYLAPSCKIRRGDSLEDSKLADISFAKMLIQQAKAWATPIPDDEDSAANSEGNLNVHDVIDSA